MIRNYSSLANKDHINQVHSLIFRNHFDSLYNYGMKITGDAELVKDCIQELFFRLWKNNIDFAAINNLRAYLLKSLRHQILNTFELKYYQVNKLEITENFRVEFSPEDYYIQNQTEEGLRNKVINALNQLSEKQREAIYLRYFEELEYEEIAGIMNINFQSVKNNVHRGLVSLKELLTYALIFYFVEKSFSINFIDKFS